MKKILSLGVMILSLIVLSAVAFALPVTIDEVKVDNDILGIGPNLIDIQSLDRGQELDVKVRITGTADIDNVQIEAQMFGHDFKDSIQDMTDTFKVKSGVSYIKRLKLRLPDRLEQGQFKLRITIADRDGDATAQNYELEITADRHLVTIRDIILNPENEVRAGRTLLASLRLKNMGQKDEQGIKVKVSIPELGVSASDFVNEIEAENDKDDQATSNELFLRIPDDAETGEYTLVAEISFRDGDEVVKEETTIRVIGADKVSEAPKKEDKTKIVVPTAAQSLTAGGAELFYPITIQNLGSESKAYTVSVDSVAWGTVRVSPSNFDVVAAGDQKTFNVNVKANSDAAGSQIFMVTVKSGDNVLQQIPLTASISGAGKERPKLTGVLEVLAIVLVILIIIILLVFGLSRVTKKEDNEDKEDEAYY